nr:hypothetical protein [uncultured Gellertiella sp.]
MGHHAIPSTFLATFLATLSGILPALVLCGRANRLATGIACQNQLPGKARCDSIKHWQGHPGKGLKKPARSGASRAWPCDRKHMAAGRAKFGFDRSAAMDYGDPLTILHETAGLSGPFRSFDRFIKRL